MACDIKKYSRGDPNIRQLELFLRATHDYYGVIEDHPNEYYGEVLVSAVKKYQKRHGLYVDGQAGTKTTGHMKLECVNVAPNPTPTPTSSGKVLVYPTSSFKQNSLGYGAEWSQNRSKRHCGVDVNRDEAGTHVKSIKEGIVKHVNVTNEWDTVVCIEHTSSKGAKYTSVYWHIEQVAVNEGQTVSTGQHIGVIGRNNGVHRYHDHLHFGIRYAPYDGNMSLKGALDKGIFPEKFRDPVAFLKQFA